MRQAAEKKMQEQVLEPVEKDLQSWRTRHEEAIAEIESDIRRQRYFNLVKQYKQ